jgi:signal peptidase II
MHQKLSAFAVTALIVLGVAQAGSYLVQALIPINDTYVLTSFLHFTHIRNTGAVFGMFPGNSTVFAITSSLTILVLCAYMLKDPQHGLYQYVCFGFIVGAAASNVCDRVLYGAVIDFIDVQGIPYWHYIFNIADLSIHIGVWPLLIAAVFPPMSPVSGGGGRLSERASAE